MTSRDGQTVSVVPGGLLMHSLLLVVVGCGPSNGDVIRQERELLRIERDRLEEKLRDEEARTRALELELRSRGTVPPTRPTGPGPGDFPMKPRPPGPAEPSGDPGQVPPPRRR